MGGVVEDHVGPPEASPLLDVHLVRSVDHDFGDGGVFQQRLQRPQPHQLAGDGLDQSLSLTAREGQAVFGQKAGGQVPHLLAKRRARQARQPGNVGLGDEAGVEAALQGQGLGRQGGR